MRNRVFLYKYSKTVFFIVFTIAVSGFLNSYFGWYGYEKWKYRVSTNNIADSKRRGVFVKELHFKIDSFSGKIDDFHVYLEKGFHFGHQSEDQTINLLNSNYPYQLSLNFRPTSKLGIYLRDAELNKFDSSDVNRGYLKSPHLKDTIRFYLNGENVHSGVIKVWE